MKKLILISIIGMMLNGCNKISKINYISTYTHKSNNEFVNQYWKMYVIEQKGRTLKVNIQRFEDNKECLKYEEYVDTSWIFEGFWVKDTLKLTK